MKNYLNKILILTVGIITIVPSITFADWGYSDYGGSDWGYSDYYSAPSSNWGYSDYYSNSNSNWGYSDYYSAPSSNWGYTDYYSNNNSNWGYTDYYSNSNNSNWGYTDYYSSPSSNWGYTDYYSNSNNSDWGYTDYYSNNSDWGYTDYYTNNSDWGYTDYYSNNNSDWGYTDYYDNNSDWGYADYEDFYSENYENPYYLGDDGYYYADSFDYYEYDDYYDYYDYYSYDYYDRDCVNCERECRNCDRDNDNDRDRERITNPRVSCEVSDSKIKVGESVTFSADAIRGETPYDFTWSGAVSGSSRTITKTFNSVGTYTARIEVKDDNGRKDYDTCSVRVTEDEQDEDEDEDLDIQCRVSDTSIREDDRVTVEVLIRDGKSPFRIKWSGDADEIDDFDDDARRQTVRIEDSGRYALKVSVTDDNGERATENCPIIRVGDEDDDDQDVRVFTSTNNPPNGQLASVDSVFLSQLPYTGPEDWLKVSGFLSAILLWSAVIGYFMTKDRKKKQISNKILAFKLANREQKINN